MEERSAKIKINYYHIQVAEKPEESDDEICFSADTERKFEQLLKQCNCPINAEPQLSSGQRANNSVILQSISEIPGGFWKLLFIKVRDEALPGKVNASGEYTEIKLEEDEYVGEDMTMIYAPDKHLLAIQKNYFSVSATRAIRFFNSINDDFEFKLELLTNSNEIPTDALIRSIEVSCLDICGGELNEVIKGVDTFGAKSVQLKLNVGVRKKDAHLTEKAINAVNELRGKPFCKKLKVGYKETPDALMTEIDFVTQRLEDSVTIKYSKIDTITHEKIYEAMLPKFKEMCKTL